MANTYDVGDRAVLRAEFGVPGPDGAFIPTNPTAVSVKIRKPSGSELSLIHI